jgi:signal peptidase I
MKRAACKSGGMILLLALCGCGKQTVRQESASMEPTIQRGEKIAVNTRAYYGSDPQRWEVILYKPIQKRDAIWAHRVVGLPGETVSFNEHGVLVNGEPLPARLKGINYVPTNALTVGPQPLPHPLTVPAESYYVLGDNPTSAMDSRFYGPVQRPNIRGRVEGK